MYLVKILGSYHSGMLALVPPSASPGIFEPTIVKRIGEDPVNAASGKGLAVYGSKTPFVVDYIQDLGRAVTLSKYQVPHLPYQLESVRVFDDPGPSFDS
ncbi:MAG: hypothetical protein JRI41_10545 [Deltaproteobacteria bacterium]|nr:hypothetical protein [Deltaproteobacteria bacterium]